MMDDKKVAMKTVILVGRININHPPIGGETAKNQILVEEIGKYCRLLPLDVYGGLLKKLLLLPIFIILIMCHPKAPVIFSTTFSNVYRPIKLLMWLFPRRKFVHWVIGGEFDKKVKAGEYDINTLKKITCNVVAGKLMEQSLISMGLNNVRYIPNCKKYFQVDDSAIQKEWLYPAEYRFVYMGRITRPKGVDMLLNVVGRLNDNNYGGRFSVDFYGYVEPSFKSDFDNYVSLLPNVNFLGPLDIQGRHGYNTLSNYHLMIFPTHHKSEGFAGVFIDAFIAGIPVLTTKWNCNEEIIIDGYNGIVIPANDEDALFSKLVEILDKSVDLQILAQGSKNSAEKYRSDIVISKEILKETGIL